MTFLLALLARMGLETWPEKKEQEDNANLPAK